MSGFVLALSVKGIVTATGIVSIIGLLIGLFLGLASKKLEVPIDETEEKVRDLLPGANCGGCGYAGCDACAKAIAIGEAAANVCPVASSDIHAEIAKVIGSNVEATEKQVAYVDCLGTCDRAKVNSTYYGPKDCKLAAGIGGNGSKACNYGCMGFGSCVKVCAFDAIHIVDGVAVVDKEKCTACGMCVAECPNNIIEMVPVKARTFVGCSSFDKGKDVKTVCSIGCIGCKLCVKACEFDAIHVENNLAKIDYSKCTNCGACVKVCPVKVIEQQAV
ncbi:MAG: RnfABCDGE type electron transport complex subunit B [Clostridiales bacterium]|nr:RnfABCDGE type electron transport complex subunit B [Clostridiales bacterium]